MKSKYFYQSISCALNGLYSAIKSEKNLQIHVVCLMSTSVVAYLYKFSITQWCILLLCQTIVISFELINTAIEQLANKVTPHYDDTIKSIKDIAASSVLVAAMFSCIIGILLFFPYVKQSILSIWGAT